MTETCQSALFPLNTVLFPEGPLALRIFEPRYLDMIKDCMRNDAPFGVCLIRKGNEAGDAATPCPVGTLARIVDWDRLDNGLLGITALGTQRFRIHNTFVADDKLLRGEIEILATEPAVAIAPKYRQLEQLADKLIDHAGDLYRHGEKCIRNATWLGYRLAELLPVPAGYKQRFLEMEDPLLRLEQIEKMIDHISQQAIQKSGQNPGD